VKRSTLRAFLSVVSLASLVSVTASSVRADDTKKACAEAYTQAQTLRDAHKLKGARDLLRLCSQSTCSAFIMKDCTAWLLETEGRVPSVVLSAKDGSGQPLADVTVSIDGTALAQKLDGQSIEVDPGPHTFTFVTSDGRKMEQRFAVLEGQKAQSVTVTFAPPASVPGPVPGTPLNAEQEVPKPASPATGPSFWTTQRGLGVAAAGLGVAGVVVGSIFGLAAKSAVNQQNGDCASPSCSSSGHAQALSEHSTAATDSTLSTVTFIAGGALLAGGAVLLLTGGRRSEPAPSPTSTGLVWMPSVGPAGGGMFLRGEF
jgi:hypothetical protein